eukprot:3852939-Pleurochrysis_carterae.AAC.3
MIHTSSGFGYYTAAPHTAIPAPPFPTTLRACNHDDAIWSTVRDIGAAKWRRSLSCVGRSIRVERRHTRPLNPPHPRPQEPRTTAPSPFLACDKAACSKRCVCRRCSS